MTIRIDLHTRPLDRWPWQTLIRRNCYGCADCGRWFDDPHAIVTHQCPAREADR